MSLPKSDDVDGEQEPGHGLFTTSKGSQHSRSLHLWWRAPFSPSISPPFFSYTSESHLEEHMGHLDSYWTLLLEFVIQGSRSRPESLHSSQFPRGAKANCLGTNHPSALPSLSLLSTLPARQPWRQIFFRCFYGLGNLPPGLPPDDHRMPVVI